MTEDQLVKKLLEAKEAYYNGQPIMTDPEFDAMEDELESINPDSYYFSIVGTNIKGSAKVKHDEPMLSCGKGKVIEDIMAWVEKINCDKEELCITPKYDGLSFSAEYKNGILICLSTRGDGKIGESLTDKIRYFKNIKTKISDLRHFEIRGEIILKKEYSSIFNNKPLRNVCVGLTKRKDDFDMLKYISFVAYNVVGIDFKTEKEKLDFLKSIRCSDYSTSYDIMNKDDIFSIYKDWIKFKREQFEYEVDGLVITINNIELQKKHIGNSDHHYNYQIAFKFPSIMVKSTMIDIVWEISRLGELIPVAIIEPVYILDRKVQKASLSNYGNVIFMQMEIGDEVLISLSNDVIPYIEKNITKGISQR